MGLSNGKLAKPISIADIANALGTNIRDLGCLCSDRTSSSDSAGAVRRINKFAKYRSVEYNSPAELTEANRQSTNWGYGTGGIPSYASWSALRTALVGGITPGENWSIVYPSTWYRALDFDGYASSAVRDAEWGSFGVTGINNSMLYIPFGGMVWIVGRKNTVSPYDKFSFIFDWTEPEVNETGLLYLSDFADMAQYSSSYYDYSQWYFGVLMVPQTLSPSAPETVAYIVSSGTRLADATNSSIGLSNIPFTYGSGGTVIPAGDYYLYPVLSSRYASQLNGFAVINGWSGASAGPGRIIFLDGWRLPLTLSLAPNYFTTDYTYDSSTGVLAITFNNRTASALTFANNNLFIYVESEGVVDSEFDAIVVDAVAEWGVPTGTSNGGVRYSSGIKNSNNVVVAAYFTLYAAVVAANGNSNILAAGGSVTVNVNIGTQDALGNPYNEWMVIIPCSQARYGSGSYLYYAY